jgi:hypothetical protein
VSRDGGRTFTEVGKNIQGLPSNHRHWVSRISASHFDPATAYVSIDGHRSDDLKPYVHVTRDYGATWQSLVNNLPPLGNIQVVREDPKNKDLLYVGTEFGLYISVTGGKEWKKFMGNLPTVRVDDLLVHPRENDLIVATHGRSIWIADDISPLQQLTPEVPDSAAHLFDIRPAVLWLNDQQLGQQIAGQRHFQGDNPSRGTAIHYHLKSPEEVTLAIADVNGRTIRTIRSKGNAGINRVQWNLQADPPEGRGAQEGQRGGGRGGGGGSPVEPGTYIVTMTAGATTVRKPVTVLRDVWMSER